MRRKAMKAATTACMPRLTRGNCHASMARPAEPASLLKRIRDVVLRLIMLTTLSKATSPVRAGGHRGREPAAVAVVCRREESIRNEAVEECIDFLKRSSAEGNEVKLSSVTTETVAAAMDMDMDMEVDDDARGETLAEHGGAAGDTKSRC